jgi:hypothetical protein
MADGPSPAIQPQSIVDLIDQLLGLVATCLQRPRRGQMSKDETARMKLLDAQIGSECQIQGIAIPQLEQTFSGNVKLFGFTRIPTFVFAGRFMVIVHNDNWRQAMLGLRLVAAKSLPQGMRAQTDTASDESKKAKKKKYRRTMTNEASDCVRLFKKAKRVDQTTRMGQIVREYAEKSGASVTSILRILSDNPDQWKP